MFLEKYFFCTSKNGRLDPKVYSGSPLHVVSENGVKKIVPKGRVPKKKMFFSVVFDHRRGPPPSMVNRNHTLIAKFIFFEIGCVS